MTKNPQLVPPDDTTRSAIGQIVDRMPVAARAQLTDVLTQFATAGGEPAEADLWAAGWATRPDHADN